jgi:hypothetical protein
MLSEGQLLSSRVTGQVAVPGLHMSGKRVNQALGNTGAYWR